ncbi:DUF418 domain-containing protein [Paenibacillus paeoniae]|uniref:DUF418 domain-containing protein n=1 Tax=Paenibacillus paeoniae TaxID=2292705 RepID=A0A371PEF1_9BACL|nr:DUF418 domain-containing protein [Paenibacillus paeoniae]REK74302.1 DUF418 domain-containing protein [Paenibacillus paeoniae]
MIRKTGRQSIVDEIRGMSLLGILLANMLFFQYGMWGLEELSLFDLSRADSIAHTLLKILIEGSFMPIFAFLFGYGMLKMMEGLEAKGAKFRRVLVRRAVMLALLGLAHSLLLWEGDILMFYGFMSLFLLLFLKRKAKTVLIWGIVLLTLLSLGGIGATDSASSTLIDKSKSEPYVQKSVEVYQNGSYSDILHFRNNEEPPLEANKVLLVFIALLVPLLTAPMFLFGMYAARKGWFHEAQTKRSFYAKWAVIFLIAGLIMKSLKYIWPHFILSGVGEISGMTILAIGYLMGFGWLLSLGKAASLRKGFEAVGRLSLTNYLMQTVICTTLFYGYGLGWFGKLGILAGIGIGIAVYIVQWLGSALYLKRFRIGPVESLLRMGTYWSWKGKLKQRPSQTGADMKV